MRSILPTDTLRNTFTHSTKTIYFTTTTHNVNRTQLVSATETTSTDATTREKLPEASPKGPGPTHLMALAGQRSNHTERTLVLQGLASRSPKPETKQPSPEKTTSYNQQTPLPPLPYLHFKTLNSDMPNSSHRPYIGTSGGRRTPCPKGPCQSFPYPINPALPENSSLKLKSNTPQYNQQMITLSLPYLHLNTLIFDILNSPPRPYTGTSGDRRTLCPTGPCQSFPYPINPALPEKSSLKLNSNTPQYNQQMPTPSLPYLHLKTLISDILNSPHKPYT